MSPIPCCVLEVNDDGTIAVDVEGSRLELWNHEPARLRAVVDQYGDAASYQPRWRLLRIPRGKGATQQRAAYCFDVVPALSPDRRTCPIEPPRHGTLARQLMEAGGITVSGSEVARWLGEGAPETH